MSSQVRKNVTNPHNSLFHHGLIKLLVLAKVETQGKTWDDFIYHFSNPHLTIKARKNTLYLRTISPSKPHSPRTPNPPTQAIYLSEQKSKKLVDIPASSSGKKTKKPIVNLKAQLKQHKRHKTKSSWQEGEASKADPPQQA